MMEMGGSQATNGTPTGLDMIEKYRRLIDSNSFPNFWEVKWKNDEKCVPEVLDDRLECFIDLFFGAIIG